MIHPEFNLNEQQKPSSKLGKLVGKILAYLIIIIGATLFLLFAAVLAKIALTYLAI